MPGGSGVTFLALSKVTQVWIWGGVIILAALVIGIALGVMRRRLYEADAQAARGLSMEQIEKLRDQGQISQEEFSILRRTLIGTVGGEEKGASRLSPGPEDDDGKKDTAR